MSSTTCIECGVGRLLGELLGLVDNATGRRRFVCRPSIRPSCFNTIARCRDCERLELASEPDLTSTSGRRDSSLA